MLEKRAITQKNSVIAFGCYATITLIASDTIW